MRETVVIEEDEDGNLIIPLSKEILEALHVEIGDGLGFEKLTDGTFRLFKI